MEPWEDDLAEAYEAFKEDNCEEALAYATKAIEGGCTLIEIYKLRASCYMELSNYKAALKDLETYLKKEKDDIMMVIYRGICNLNLGDHKKAIKDFDKAVKQRPNDGDAYYYRGVCQSYLENFKKAIEDLDKAEKFGSKEIMLYRQRGFSHYCIKHYQEAKADVLHYTTLRDTDDYCYFVLSKIETEFKNYHEAIKYLSKAIYLNGEKSEYYIDRMKLYLMTDQGDKSTADFERAASLGRDTMGVMVGGKFMSLADMDKLSEEEEENDNDE